MSSNRFIPIPQGTRYGSWTVMALGSNVTGQPCRWICVCDCGAQREVASVTLRNGSSTGCGCNRKGNVTHGGSGTRTHRIWKNVWTRCTNPRVKSYKDYGGRGIKVCARWRSFAAFFEDMGECPPKMSIDRIDNDKGYEPGNCRWATKKVQANNTRSNRRYTLNGRTQTVSQWAEEIGIPYNCLLYRHMNGWDAETALTTPSKAERVDA